MNKAETQRDEARDFYNSYQWEKVTWATFYQRVRNCPSAEWEWLVAKKLCYKRRDSAPKGKRANEMIRYNEQPEPRASKSLFRNRLNSWYPKEKAILIWDEWVRAKDERKITHPQVAKPYIPKPAPRQPDEWDFLIKITYPKEVARAFRKEYVNMIEQLEWEMTYTSEKTEIVELNEKLERVKRELIIFNYYNK